ncbi:methylated-DNA--[protein]-cysteine S-methyltransferase [Engelhardtia mirabilis]|uniref:Methylated-DNA--protein-cysteine methyltransferase n=1 Tax=Engelhardtia mirabilis TaxID=2528011 RepID=A0A518BF17_9BACT|nr:Methylated-DNA--protein-cysteine methyltransferase, inducible [Planctomycetes bacterium Pla133]QDU99809.1 Methylated-DNA--protein-cysteine methyltransferase, inducible [Planctomycetes bacterium Pla86]
MTLFATTIESAIGPMRAVAGERGLRELTWSAPGDAEAVAPVSGRNSHGSIESDDLALFADLTDQLAQYFDGKRQTFDLPLDLVGTPFQLAAWRALCAIPFGQTRSYAQQAAAIGRPSATRAVGAANGRNPVIIVVPCHRVVGADGSLTGFGAGLPLKRRLLEHESRLAGTPGPRGSIADQPLLPFGPEDVRPELRHRE